MDQINPVLIGIAALVTAILNAPLIYSKIQKRRINSESKKLESEASQVDAERESLNVKTAGEVVKLVESQMQRLGEENVRISEDNARLLQDVATLKEQVHTLINEVNQLKENERVNLINHVATKQWANDTYRRFRDTHPDLSPPPGWEENPSIGVSHG